MRICTMILGALVGAAALGAAAVTTAQNVGDSPAPASPAATHAAQPIFSPGFADLMTMLVQPRHLKLYYAGMQGNWELAAFESRALSASLRRIGQAIPRYRDSGSVDEAVDDMMGPGIKAVDAAITAGDSKQFTKAFGDLTAGCNACHTYTEHPFVVIQVPEANAKNFAYPNEDFRAMRP